MTTDDLPDFKVFDAEEHRIEARLFLARAEQPGLAAEGAIAYAAAAIAHALLAASAPPSVQWVRDEKGSGPGPAMTLLVLGMLCGTVLAVVWLLSR